MQTRGQRDISCAAVPTDPTMPDSVPPDRVPPAGPLTRRRVLRLGGGGALALVIGAAAGWADRRDGNDPQAAPTTTSTSTTTTSTTTTTTSTPPLVAGDLGPVDPGIVALGERVIAVTGEGDLQTLLRLLPLTDDDATGDPLDRAALVTRREFEAGDTVDIDGWILSVSEARAAAVAALLCRDTGC